MLPIKYNAKNVVLRWRSTLATILGIALVVAVYVMVQALAVGLEKSSANTGDPQPHDRAQRFPIRIQQHCHP